MSIEDISRDVTTIDLLRHGACENGESFRGTIDVALSEEGWQQMQSRISALKKSTRQDLPYSRIVSSPMRRCSTFAEQLSSDHKIPFEMVNNFREMSFGDWEGQAINHIQATQTEAIAAWTNDPVNSPPPGGERADDLVSRVTQAIETLVKQYRGEHLLVVSHGGVMRAALSFCLSMPIRELNRFHIPYACLSRIQIVTDGDKNYYRLLNHNNYEPL